MLDDIKKTLWATADKLRANMDAAEYKHLVLGLIFLKYVSDTFVARRLEVEARLKNPDDEFYYGEADAEDIAAELEDRDYYKTKAPTCSGCPKGHAGKASARWPKTWRLASSSTTR